MLLLLRGRVGNTTRVVRDRAYVTFDNLASEVKITISFGRLGIRKSTLTILHGLRRGQVEHAAKAALTEFVRDRPVRDIIW